MKKVCLLFVLLGICAASVQAATVAYWRFEDGADGANVDRGGQADGTYYPGVTDESGNGYELSAWSNGGYAGYIYRANVASESISLTGASNTLSVKNTGGYPALWTATGDAIQTITPAAFTLEATFKLENGGNRTIIGRDSRGSVTTGNGDLSALYFQAVPNNGLAIKYCDVSGYWHEAISAENVFISYDFNSDPDGLNVPWYTMAAVSDGTTLSLYVKEIGAGQYQLIAQTDLTLSDSPDTALSAGTGDGGDWDAGNWTVGRGLYAGGHVDRAWGFIDEVRISDTALTPTEFLYGPTPYYPIVDQTAGINDVDVVLNWHAAGDPAAATSGNAVHPDIAAQYVFMSDGSDDPNLYYHGQLGDPGTVEPFSTYPAGGVLKAAFDSTYYWAVVEGMTGYTQTFTASSSLNAVDPNNLIGPVWSFTTDPQEARISSVSPVYTAVDATLNPVVELSVTANAAQTYQWYRIAEPLDEQLSDGAEYQGTDTAVLSILNVQQADEGYYYCVASNSVPSSDSNRDTGPGRVMTQRLTSYYPFETTGVVDGNTITPDTVGGFDAVLLQEAASAGMPTLDGTDGLPGLGTYLHLDNGDHAADPNGQFAQLPAGVVDYEDLTISFWVHPKGDTIWGRVFDFGYDQTHSLFLTPDTGAGQMRFAIRQTGDGQQLNTRWFDTGVWYHVAVTIGGNTGRLYVNGELVAANNGMTLNPIDIGATVNYIGKSFWPDPELNGLIDELKIYNYAVSGYDIAQEYLAVQGGWVCDNEGSVDLTFDLNDDCQVDLGDFALMAADWLNSNRIYPQ